MLNRILNQKTSTFEVAPGYADFGKHKKISHSLGKHPHRNNQEVVDSSEYVKPIKKEKRNGKSK